MTSSEIKPQPAIKKCGSCRRTLPRQYFGNYRASEDGLTHDCNQCANYRKRKRYREKYGIIRPKPGFEMLPFNPNFYRNNKDLLHLALKAMPWRGYVYQVSTGVIGQVSIMEVGNNHASIQVVLPDNQGNSYHFNRFNPMHLRNVSTILSNLDLRLVPTMEELQLAKATFFSLSL